jgi:hypothetical protein
MAAKKAMANKASPMNTVPTWIVSHRLLKSGFTGSSVRGMADEIIMRNAAKGATNDPKTISLNLDWMIRYTQIMDQAKNPRADLRSRIGAVPNR